MSILPLSSLGSGELALLGNNLCPRRSASRAARRRRNQVRAVNRSLAVLGEQVQRLHAAAVRPGPTVVRHV
jgi:hypothetical protein